MPSTRRHAPLGSIAAVLYMLSLALPAIVVVHEPLLWGSPRDETMIGLLCLLVGWFTVPWYANVLLWIASLALVFRRPRLAAACSLAAIGLALSTFVYLGADLRYPHAGYFAWLASMVLVFVDSCARSLRARTPDLV